MTQKTAMMELIEWLSLNGMKPDIGIPDIKAKAKELLEKEKEQIELAYDSGYIDGDKGNPSAYYHEIFLDNNNL